MMTLYACGVCFLTVTTTAKFQRCAISMNLVAKEIGRVQGSVYLWCREMSTMVLYMRPMDSNLARWSLVRSNSDPMTDVRYLTPIVP